MNTLKSNLLGNYFSPTEKEIVEGCIKLMQSDELDSPNWELGVLWLESYNLYSTFIQMLKEYYKECGFETYQKKCKKGALLDELFLHYAFAREVSIFHRSIEFSNMVWWNEFGLKKLKLPLFPLKLKYDIHTSIEHIGVSNIIDYPISLEITGEGVKLFTSFQDNIDELIVSENLNDIKSSAFLEHILEYANIKTLKFEMYRCLITRLSSIIEGKSEDKWEEVWEDIHYSVYFGTIFERFKHLKKLELNMDVIFDYNTFALPPNIEQLKLQFGDLQNYSEVKPFNNFSLDLSGYPHLQTIEIIPTTPAVVATMSKYGFKWNMWNNRYEKME